jgi:hypothetical protein
MFHTTRREFIQASLVAGALMLGGKAMAARLAAMAPSASIRRGYGDTRKTGIQTSRLAMGTGTVGSAGTLTRRR